MQGKETPSIVRSGQATRHEVSQENSIAKQSWKIVVHFACMTSITCLRGSVLILLAPVNG
jgi:hypothetical protein